MPFKSWFIDLEPFNGEVPENWSTGVLKDILQLKKDGIKAIKYLTIISEEKLKEIQKEKF